MRILACHNYYQQPGGEDRCFEDECALLESRGHDVVRYELDNDHIVGWRSILTAGKSIWNPKSYRAVRQLIEKERVDIVHCTNTFPEISPAIYYACNRARVPVVQSLQNYRLLCANSYLLRDGKVCEKCVGKTIALPAIQHGCYRESRLATSAVVAMQSIHKLLGSWSNYVDQFVVPTEFAREKFVSAGLPANRLFVKPNFVDPVPKMGDGSGGYALFAGRLSGEKGIATLLDAWKEATDLPPLRIIGDGPLRSMVEMAAKSNPLIQYLGFHSAASVSDIMSQASMLVVPSLWYEGLPRTIVESLAVGTPIVVSDIGPLGGLANPQSGGMSFQVGNSSALKQAVQTLATDTGLTTTRREAARREFMTHYTADANYSSLMNIYAAAQQVRVSRNQVKSRSTLGRLPFPSTKAVP